MGALWVIAGAGDIALGGAFSIIGVLIGALVTEFAERRRQAKARWTVLVAVNNDLVMAIRELLRVRETRRWWPAQNPLPVVSVRELGPLLSSRRATQRWFTVTNAINAVGMVNRTAALTGTRELDESEIGNVDAWVEALLLAAEAISPGLLERLAASATPPELAAAARGLADKMPAAPAS
ncbi:MAG: hypothetical protein ACJ77M_08785 [Thermoleophilaceae bacterium]